MRKTVAIFALVLVLLALCSCENKPCTEHDYVENASEEYLLYPAGCLHRATYLKSCSVCGEKGSETFTAGDFIPHDILDEKGYDEDQHWDKCSRGCQLNKADHTMKDGVCDCGYRAEAND